MLGRIFTVGGLTLVSRFTGFARDIVLAAVLGAGPVADAFFVALRLPNHFRAIFADRSVKYCFSAVMIEGWVLFGLFPFVSLILLEAGEPRSSIAAAGAYDCTWNTRLASEFSSTNASLCRIP